MDDNDAKNTGGKYRMIPIFEKAVSMAVATKGLKIMVGSGADGSTYPHGTQALDFEWLVKRGRHESGASDSGRHHRSTPKHGMAGPDRLDRRRASSPISSPCPATRWPTSPSFSA